MNRYIIYESRSAGDYEVARLEAKGHKDALKRFKETLTSSGLYEIHMKPSGCYELCSTYGKYWYSVKEE